MKASQLLFVLLTHLEETAVITQYADTLLSLMHMGTKDTERSVVENASHSYLLITKQLMSLFLVVYTKSQFNALSSF
jgi:hypothetical protein